MKLTIRNQKEGVGKTTLTINIAGALKRQSAPERDSWGDAQ